MRRIRPLTILLLLALLLSACSFGGTPEDELAPEPGALAQANPNPASGETVMITFGVQEYERQTYEPLVESFNAENPDVQVQLVSLDEVLRDEGGQGFSASSYTRRIVSAADTAKLSFLDEDAVTQGFFTNLKPLMEADASFDQQDFYPSAFAPTSDGGIPMLPSTLRVQMLSYNKALWAAANLPAPTPDWTWNDVTAAAEALAQKRGNDVQVYGLLDWSGFSLLLNELLTQDANVFISTPEDARLDTPEVAAAIARVAELAKSGALYIPDQGPGGTISSDDFQNLIKDQQAGMWRSELAWSGPDNQQPPFEVGTAAFPPLPLSIFNSPAEGFVISSGTQHPQAAWRWLAYLSRQTIPSAFQGPGDSSIVPARPSLAERSGYWDKLDTETAAVVRAVLERPVAPVAGTFNGQAFGPMTEALNDVVYNNKTAEVALRDAQQTYDQQLAQVQQTPTAVADSGPIIVATPVAQVAPEGATTITFSDQGFDQGRMRQVAREFNQSNGAVFVDLKSTQNFTGSVSLPDIARSSDCFSWWNAPFSEEITATLNLRPLSDADGSFDMQDYPAALLAPFEQGTALHGLPFEAQLQVLSYNATAFERAGLEPPTAGWTLAQFVNAAQQLTSGSGNDKRYGFVPQNGGAQDALFFLQLQGVKATNGSGANATPNYTDPAVVQALRGYLDLLKTSTPLTKLSGYEEGSWNNDIFQLISEGRAAMWFDNGNQFNFGGPQPDMQIAVAPPPFGAGGVPADAVRSSGLFISASTPHAAQCWAWLKYLSGQAVLYQQGFPARQSVAQSPAFTSTAQPGAADVYSTYLRALKNAPAGDMAEPIFLSKIDFYWLFRALDRGLQGKDLERELAAAQRTTEQYLACVAGTEKPSVCANQVDPSYNGWRTAENDLTE